MSGSVATSTVAQVYGIFQSEASNTQASWPPAGKDHGLPGKKRSHAQEQTVFYVHMNI